MGQVCISEEDQIRIVELQLALEKQEKETAFLQQELEAERERYNAQKKEAEGITSQKLKQLEKEKEGIFKSMLKQNKQINKFDDEIENHKKRQKSIQASIDTLKFEKEEKAKQEKEEEEYYAKIIEEEAERKRKESEADVISREPSIRTRTNQKQTFQLAGLGHIGAALDSIKMPALDDIGDIAMKGIGSVVSAPVKGVKGIGKGVQEIGKGFGKLMTIHNDDNDPLPFKVRHSLSESDTISDHDYHDDDDDDDEYHPIERTETVILDSGFDVQSEIAHVYSWLYKPPVDPNKKEDVKQLKFRLASLLTHRSEKYRENLAIEYYEEYGKRLGTEVKKILQKGNALHIIKAMLMTRAQYDAVLISDCIKHWDIEPVADIICCRNIVQLKELHEAFKTKCKGNMKKQLQTLAQKEKKRTLVKVIGRMLDLKRKERVKVAINEVNKDVNFILTTKSFKNEKKEKLVLVFCSNSVQYIKVLNDQFKLKSKDSLCTFIDKKLGPNSTVGYFCKVRIEYALDTPEYYAKIIKKLGVQFGKNKAKISDVFIQRIEIDLDLIQRRWNMKKKKFGDGKSLKEWVIAKCGKGSSSGTFLSKMLDQCPRYAEFNKEMAPKLGGKLGGAKFAQMMMMHSV